MKVSEMSGDLLDYWVARAEGMDHETALFAVSAHAYSTEWVYGGPIIERERFVIDGHTLRRGGFSARHVTEKVSAKRNVRYVSHYGFGPTVLIAAMRAFVAAKFGKEVPDAV
ncbi:MULTISPECIES: phage protein NinX family protein [unclassified Burkholderia]|uniref:phage protein NinX family protein n=1 Tax=unclassified Burkholderia TaxID=2613784 RepID=UPI002AB1D492|nr:MULTISPECIES: phage protein NinX family protein [unclassified Burkholderia]